MKVSLTLLLITTASVFTLQAQNTPITKKAGVGLFKQGKYKEAQELFSKAAEEHPDSAWPYVGRANAYVKLKDTNKAIDDYNKAIEVDKNYATAYTGIGMVEFYRGHYDTALYYMNKAITIKPEEAPEAYAFRGMIKDYKKDTVAALADFNKALDLRPNVYEAYYGRAELKYEKKDYKGALKDFNKAATISPDMPAPLVGKAKSLSKTKKYDDAADAFNAAVALDNNYAPIYEQEGIMEIDKKEFKTAVNCFAKAIKAAPKNGLYYAEKGMAEQNVKGDTKDACTDLNKAKDLGYTDPDFESALSQCN